MSGIADSLTPATSMGWSLPRNGSQSLIMLLLSVTLMVTPALTLGIASVQYRSLLMLAGAFVVFTLSLLVLRSKFVWRPPISSLMIMLYVIALGWFWFTATDNNDTLARFIRGLLIFTAMMVFIVHDFAITGVEPRRIARKCTNEILMRNHWPKNVLDFGRIPVVRRLRLVAEHDPSLAFVLLEGRCTEVQIAGLMALQGRTSWRWEEASVVLKLGQKAFDPEVRALAIHAVAHAETAEVIRGIAEFLKDTSPIVREAAVESLVTNGANRWGVVRGPIRDFLANATFAKDGALHGAAGRLPAISLCDFTSWVTEPAPLAERSMKTLLAHYEKVIETQENQALPSELGRQLIDEATPPALRIEMAILLRKHNLIPPELLDRMTDADQPGPIRLLAAEELLKNDPNDSSAIDVLRGIGRLSNRESALVVARMLQAYQNIDFGLPIDNTQLPANQLLEITKLVSRWATGRSLDSMIDNTPAPMLDPSRSPRPRNIAESDPGAARKRW